MIASKATINKFEFFIPLFLRISSDSIKPLLVEGVNLYLLVWSNLLRLVRKLQKKSMRNSFKAFWSQYWLIILISLVGLIVRLVYLTDTIAIAKDQSDHIQWAMKLFENHGYLWHGPRLRGGDAGISSYLGPFYIYLLAIPAKLGHGYFLLPTALNGVLNAISIFLIYYFAKQITDNETVGYISAILFGFSTTFIVASRTIWNPWYLPFFVLIMFISFVKIIKSEERYLPLFALFLSLNSQLHASTVLFIPTFVFLWFVFKIKIKNKLLWLYSIILVALSYGPMIYHELTNNFENLRNLYVIMFNSTDFGEKKLSYFARLATTVKKFTESFSLSLDGRVYESSWGQALWFGQHYERIIRYYLGAGFLVFAFVLLAAFIVKDYRSKKYNLMIVPLLAVLLFIPGANFFGYDPFLYYFVAALPLAYIVIAYALAKISKNIVGKVLVTLLMVLFLYVNLSSFYYYVVARQNRAEYSADEISNPDMLLKDQLDLMDFVKQDSQSKGAKFDYWFYWANVASANPDTYNYLASLKGITPIDNSDVVYLIVDPAKKPLENILNGKTVLLDKTFGSIRLIKYQVNPVSGGD